MSSPQRPTCSRRRPYIPAAVPAQWLRLLIFGNPDITATSPAGGDYHSRRDRHFSGRETRSGPFWAIRAVADKALIDKQMTVLPVRISGQAKPLIDSVSRCYLSPQTVLCVSS